MDNKILVSSYNVVLSENFMKFEWPYQMDWCTNGRTDTRRIFRELFDTDDDYKKINSNIMHEQQL